MAKPDMTTMSDAAAIAAASAPAPVTQTITVTVPPFDKPGTYRYAFYKADGAGATPHEWRCVVSGGSLTAPVDVAMGDAGRPRLERARRRPRAHPRRRDERLTGLATRCASARSRKELTAL